MAKRKPENKPDGSELVDASNGCESPIPLESPADVRRALARFLRQIHAGSLPHGPGQVLIIGCGVLSKMMREAADDEALARIEELERRRACVATDASAAPPAH